MGGSVVLSSSEIVLRVEKRTAESAVVLMTKLAASAIHRKAALQRLSGGYAREFAPFTFTVAVVSVWLARSRGRGPWERALSVLMAATSCPLTIAVPVAFVGGISVAARWGITVKSAVALEQATEVNAAILDKTGTLTEGRPTVSAFECMNQADWPHGWTRSTLLHSADQLEEFVTHPLGQAIRDYASACTQHPNRGNDVVTDVEVVNGRGVTGMIRLFGATRARRVSIGTLEFLQERHGEMHSLDREAGYTKSKSSTRTHAWLALDSVIAGAFYFDDPIRR